MKGLVFVLHNLALVLALSVPRLAPAQPCPPRGAVLEPPAAFAPGRASSFEGWMEAFEHVAGPSIPQWMIHSTRFTYEARKPQYTAKGYPLLAPDGNQVCTQVLQSGRIFFPPPWRVPLNRALPLVVYTHATTLKKHAVASEFGGHEWMLGAAAAAYYGFAVAMPDQPGLGMDAANYHPFCHAKSLAYATVDALPTIGRITTEDPFLASHGYSWDGRLFLVGYSEGAYTAMASAKELETHPQAYENQSPFTLCGSACMAGPFDLSGLTRADIINPVRQFAHVFYLPYVIRAYHAIYGAIVDPQSAFAPELLETREDGDILQWTDGDFTGLQMDDLVGHRLGYPGDKLIFRQLLNPAWLAEALDDPAYEKSAIRRILRENDLHRGWRPTRPMLFAQSPADQDIPFQNTLSALANLGAEIRKAGEDPRKLLASIPIGQIPDGISHIEGAVVAIPAAFNWFYYGMPMN